ncbi:hypothetical protein BDZ91DRAFT_638286, partial [Kalaharituber pfeilii]
QMTLPAGSTILPIILAFDQTHLTNFSRDKKLWPVYMTLRNIHSSIQNKPSSHAWIPIALLPIPPKRQLGIPNYSEAAQENDTFQCADERVRICFPLLCSWLADHVKNVNIYTILQNRCPICPCSAEKFGNY